MHQNIMPWIKLTKVADHTTAGTSDVTSSIINMAGWENCVFFTSLGTAAANNNIKVQQDDDPAGGTMADLVGTKTGNGASDEDLWVEIQRPRQDQGQYVRAVVLRGTSSTCESIWCLQYNGRNPGITNNVISGTIYGEIHSSPAFGTA